MKKQLFMGLVLLLVVGCSHNSVTPSPSVKNQENQAVSSHSTNKKPKKILIDLDKEVKENGLKGGDFETIRGLILMGHNDEVSLKGEKLFMATPIRLYINGKLKATINSFEDMFKINGLEVNNGDVVVIKNRFNVELVNKRIVKH